MKYTIPGCVVGWKYSDEQCFRDIEGHGVKPFVPVSPMKPVYNAQGIKIGMTYDHKLLTSSKYGVASFRGVDHFPIIQLAVLITPQLIRMGMDDLAADLAWLRQNKARNPQVCLCMCPYLCVLTTTDRHRFHTTR